ncbi:MAG TPA: NAD(P)/FAD-dependent oxidoreductase [Pirellulales bacterium]|jgi:flavin-dependent dehydrogenase|nr:NAD(P)/FAD-dependent oxidoreductase [Pirellulales bacterium]
METKTQVIVIGGGPSGSTCSTLAAQHGLKVQLFERDHFPRFHIGESLIPETYWVLKRLGMLDKLRASHFVKKHSVQFVSESGRVSEPFYFWDNKPHECSQTWQVLRSEFDTMMLNNAREHGVDVHEGVRVLEVLMDGERARGVKIQNEDGSQHTVLADVVVDASGQTAMISNRFKTRVVDPELKKGAVWTYWQGAYRDAGRDEGATMVLQTKGKNGWFWYIPLHNNVISVGVVADFRYLFEGRGDHEKIYFEELDRCPECKRRVMMGKRVSGFYATKDYSYRSTRVAGPGWVLIGDAYGFLDPLYSSGVLLALKSGAYAADAIAEAVAKHDFSEAQLGGWGPEFNAGMGRMRRLVCEYYDGFSFGRFVKKNPHLKGHLTDLLIGDLFDAKVDDVVEPMNALRAEMRAATVE